MIITLPQAQEKLINYRKGHFFSVSFVKRTTGELRIMNCRKGVRKFVKGVGAAYDFSEKALVSVWDAQKKEYRVINLETIREIRIDGERFEVI